MLWGGMCRIVNPVRNPREIVEFWIDKGVRGDWATCDKKKKQEPMKFPIKLNLSHLC